MECLHDRGSSFRAARISNKYMNVGKHATHTWYRSAFRWKTRACATSFHAVEMVHGEETPAGFKWLFSLSFASQVQEIQVRKMAWLSHTDTVCNPCRACRTGTPPRHAVAPHILSRSRIRCLVPIGFKGPQESCETTLNDPRSRHG